MKTPVRFVLLVVSFLTFVGLLGACSSRSGSVDSPVDPPRTFSETGTERVPDRWWKSFGDTGLNRTVSRALDENFDLKTAWSRLRESRAVLERQSAELYPELIGSLSGDIRRTDSRQSFTTRDEELSLGLTAEYEVDFWGRINSNVEAEEFRTRATRGDYQTAAISLSAEVTRVWYQLLQQHHQLSLLNEQVETNLQILNLIRKQFGAGQIRRADILRQKQLLESTREQKTRVKSSIQVLEHQLAVMLGRSPQKGLNYQVRELPSLPPVPRTGLPVELIRRRPDVRSAFNRLKASDRDLAAAISNQYPRLTFTASLSTFDDNATTLFEDWARSFAGDLTGPLLDANRLDAEVDRAEAVRRQRLYEYGQAVLTAFREVEDALAEEKNLIERIEKIEDQLKLAERTIERLRSQYLNGTVDYIKVLNALNEEQQLRRDRLSARLDLLETRVSLYRALAGGFSPDRPGTNNSGNQTE